MGPRFDERGAGNRTYDMGLLIKCGNCLELYDPSVPTVLAFHSDLRCDADLDPVVILVAERGQHRHKCLRCKSWIVCRNSGPKSRCDLICLNCMESEKAEGEVKHEGK